MNKRILGSGLAAILAALLAATLWGATASADPINIYELVAAARANQLAGGAQFYASATSPNTWTPAIRAEVHEVAGMVADAARGWGVTNANGTGFSCYPYSSVQPNPQWNIYTQGQLQQSSAAGSFTAGWGAYNWPLVKAAVVKYAASASPLWGGFILPTQALQQFPWLYDAAGGTWQP